MVPPFMETPMTMTSKHMDLYQWSRMTSHQSIPIWWSCKMELDDIRAMNPILSYLIA